MVNKDGYDMKLSRIGLGTVLFGQDYGMSKKIKKRSCYGILDSAIKNGINFVDTASNYGTSEKVIGVYKDNNKFFIATKFHPFDSDMSRGEYENVLLQSVFSSLHRLNVGHLDLVYTHQADDNDLLNDNLWGAIHLLKGCDLFNHVGISVYHPKTTIKVLKEYGKLIDYVQFPYNIQDRSFDDIRPYLNKTKAISRSALANGELTSKVFGPEFSDMEEFAISSVLKEKWITSTIIGMASIKQLEQNVKVLNVK